MKKSKVLALTLCAVLLVATTVLGTMAYLTDRGSVTNTFTVGQVDITVDEAQVTPDGKPVTGVPRVTANNYHLIPGCTYTKDPTMTVDKDSEEAYVRMLVTVNCKSALDAIFAPTGANLIDIFNGYDAANWVYKTESVENDTITYEFRYKTTVKPDGTNDIVLDALFDSFTLPGTITGEQLATLTNFEITVVGHAIQAATFADADAAWAAFDNQMSNP